MNNHWTGVTTTYISHLTLTIMIARDMSVNLHTCV
jgi:hypothetical protein